MALKTASPDDGDVDGRTEFVVRFLKPRRFRKSAVGTSRIAEGHRIHQALRRLGEATASELCQVTGYSPTRVLNHVIYDVAKGFAEWGVRLG